MKISLANLSIAAMKDNQKKNNMNGKLKGILIVLVLIIVVGGLISLLWYVSKPPSPGPNVEALATCLAGKNITMYGAYWCTHCQNQKALFGSSFEKIKYVECTENEKECVEKGVEGYPTWILSDGTKLTGEQTLESLASSTGCIYSPDQKTN